MARQRVGSRRSHAAARVLQSVLIFSLLLGLLTQWEPGIVQAQPDRCLGLFQDVSKPLTELGQEIYVRLDGQPTEVTGGLYPGGRNTRPPAHEAAGTAIAAQIMPLDGTGEIDPVDGKIVMISIGMSNTESEFGEFMNLAHRNPVVNSQLFFVNGAQGGRTSDRWVDPDAATWHEVNNRLARYGLTPQQVQVAWIKQTRMRGGEFPVKAKELQSDLEAIARNLRIHYPNIKLAYFSSRTRSFTYWRGLSPEPNAFETGFSVRWMIERQLDGVSDLNFDPARGEVRTPYLSWGPYLWINGTMPRADGRVWTSDEMTSDCTHPSPSGNAMVAEMLLEFFLHDSTTTSWFAANETSAETGRGSPIPGSNPMTSPSPVSAPATALTAVPTTAPSPELHPPREPSSSRLSPGTLPHGGLRERPLVRRSVLALVLVVGGIVVGRVLMRKRDVG
jgi:hypothetical protein